MSISISVLLPEPTPAKELKGRLGITSSSTFSRWVQEAGDSIIAVGRGRATQYVATRLVRGYKNFPIYRISADGRLSEWGTLWPTRPGFVMKPADDKESDSYYEGLPWWLNDIRPEGFLGRAWIHRHASALGLKEKLQDWSDDDTLIALAEGEADVPGNLLVGEHSRDQWLMASPFNMTESERVTQYPLLAAQAMEGQLVGSSAGGEQPKFLIHLEHHPVMVKFSAIQDNAVSQRWRDLLLAEHIALLVLARHGLDAAKSEIIDVGGQRFLQVNRFDRTSCGGRHGMVLLRSLDAEFIGKGSGAWPQITAPLSQQRIITEESHLKASKLYTFGRLIGNSDMHLGNMAFLHDGRLPLSLAPIYDMLPMGLAPRIGGDFVDSLPAIAPPLHTPGEVWREMLPVAGEYWRCLSVDERCSPGFREIAHNWQSWLDVAQTLVGRLG